MNALSICRFLRLEAWDGSIKRMQGCSGERDLIAQFVSKKMKLIAPTVSSSYNLRQHEVVKMELKASKGRTVAARDRCL